MLSASLNAQDAQESTEELEMDQSSAHILTEV